MEVSLSHSSRSTFRTCKRKWYFAYVQKLRPKFKSQGLRMGSAFSDALEHNDPEVVNEFYNALLLNVPSQSHSKFVDDLAWERVVVHALAKTYLEDCPPMQREIPFEFKHKGGVERGFIDGLIVHTGMRRVTVIENKLKARWTRGEEEALATDPQVTQYVSAVLDLAGQHGIPEDVKVEDVEVVYDVTVKPGTRIKKNETPDAYHSRLVADIHERRGHYHRSFHVTRQQWQMEEFWKERDNTSAQMQEEQEYMPNYSACTMYGICEFHGICKTDNPDDIELAMTRFTTPEERDEAE